MGSFWAPTVLIDVPVEANVFNEEPFGRRACCGSISPSRHGRKMPFGGVNDLAYGSEGGPEALDVYLNTRSALIHND
jgi:succinate-semialdehyde dehydrogenase / glutarate-semialdehyde dehydrogenase